MKKHFLTLLILPCLIFSVSCKDDDSGSSGGGSSQNTSSIQFSEKNNSFYTETKQYQVVVSGGVRPYTVLGSNLGTEYFVGDTLKFTNAVGSSPTQYTIDIRDNNGSTGNFSFVSSPATVSLKLKNTNFFTARVEGISDTSSGAFIANSFQYNVLNRSFFFGSGSMIAHDNLSFTSTVDEAGVGTVSSVRYSSNPPPTSPPLFSGTYLINTNETQSLTLKFDGLGIPESFNFEFNLQTTTSNTASQNIRVHSSEELLELL